MFNIRKEKIGFGVLVAVFLIFISFSNGTDIDPVCTQLEPDDFNSGSCCRIPNVLAEKTDLLRKCEKHLATIKDPRDIDLFSKELCCFAECIFNETGSLKDGQFQADITKSILSESLKGDAEWIPILAGAVTTCEDIAKKTPSPTELKDNTCSHFSSMFFTCIDTQLFKNCPKSQWNENEQCNKLKQNAEKCPFLSAVSKQR